MSHFDAPPQAAECPIESTEPATGESVFKDLHRCNGKWVGRTIAYALVAFGLVGTAAAYIETSMPGGLSEYREMLRASIVGNAAPEEFDVVCGVCPSTGEKIHRRVRKPASKAGSNSAASLSLDIESLNIAAPEGMEFCHMCSATGKPVYRPRTGFAAKGRKRSEAPQAETAGGH